MNASGENFLPKTRGYVKIGVGSQQGLAKIFFEFAGQGKTVSTVRYTILKKELK